MSRVHSMGKLRKITVVVAEVSEHWLELQLSAEMMLLLLLWLLLFFGTSGVL